MSCILTDTLVFFLHIECVKYTHCTRSIQMIWLIYIRWVPSFDRFSFNFLSLPLTLASHSRMCVSLHFFPFLALPAFVSISRSCVHVSLVPFLLTWLQTFPINFFFWQLRWYFECGLWMAAYKPVSSSFKATEFQLSKVTNFRIWWNGSEMGCEHKSFYRNKVKFMSFGIDWRAHARWFYHFRQENEERWSKKKEYTHTWWNLHNDWKWKWYFRKHFQLSK